MPAGATGFLHSGLRIRADLLQTALDFTTGYDRYYRPIEERALQALADRRTVDRTLRDQIAELDRVERELLAFVRFPIEQLQTPTEIREAKAQAVETLAALNRLLELLRAGHDKAALTTPAEAFCSPERIARLELLAEELDFVRETLAEGIEPELLRRVAELRVCPDA